MDQQDDSRPSAPPARGALAGRLDAFLAGLLERTDAATAAAWKHASDELARAGFAASAIKTGQIAPDFALPDQNDRIVSLHAALRDGPVVLLFVRGGWCPFCTLTLRAMDRLVPELARSGGRLIAVSPQTVPRSQDMAERNGLRFSILADHANSVATIYGLSYELAPALRPIFSRLGHPLPEVNGTPDWRLPIPAGYVIGQDGRVAHAVVDAQVNHRLEPEEARRVLRRLEHSAPALDAGPGGYSWPPI